MNMEYWWTDIDTRTPRYTEKKPVAMNFAYQKFQTDWRGIWNSYEFSLSLYSSGRNAEPHTIKREECTATHNIAWGMQSHT